MCPLPRLSPAAQQPAPLDLARDLVIGEQRHVAPLRDGVELIGQRPRGSARLQRRMETAELAGATARRKHEHGLSRRARLAHHVDAVGGYDEEIAVREEVAVGVGALPVPEDAREGARCLLDNPAQPVVRAPGWCDEEAHAEPPERA